MKPILTIFFLVAGSGRRRLNVLDTNQCQSTRSAGQRGTASNC